MSGGNHLVSVVIPDYNVEWYVDAAFIVKAIEQKHTEHE